MNFKLNWLSIALRQAGLTVREMPGWLQAGHGDFGQFKGILLHHTAGPAGGNAPSLATVKDGRPGLQGPLANLFLARNGDWYVIAAGRAYHAGEGEYKGIKAGNSEFIGIEAENTGQRSDPWPEEQLESFARGVAALAKHGNIPLDMICGHKDYALPRGRKPDPSFSVADFRERVSTLMGLASPSAPAEDKDFDPIIAELQKGLLNAGFSVGATGLDGRWGPSTKRALEQHLGHKI